MSSRQGRGTMFRLAIALGGLHEIRDATAAADTQPMPSRQARAVLVIDDEEAIREGLSILLEEWGYEVVAAGSADEARRAAVAMALPPDLILSDLHLGDGPDGLDAIAAVRRQCGYEVPAIVVTGDTAHGELQRAADAGHTVLVKPLQPRKLLSALRGMLP
jgi:CheY-like chemotaxis protein